MACTCPEDSGSRIFRGRIPRVAIDINRTLANDLRTCNIRNARVIYLLCNQTSDNIRLVRAIRAIFDDGESKTSMPTAKPIDDSNHDNLDSDELMMQYFGLPSGRTLALNNSDGKPLPGHTICYISYSSDGEREFYSLDDVFLERIGRLTTYFINIHEICIKQMLAEYSISAALEITKDTTTRGLIKKLDDTGIAVAGSGPLLGHVIPEIARNCIYNLIAPLEIINLVRHSSDESSVSLCATNDIFRISKVSFRDFKSMERSLNLLFIASDDANEIRSILHAIYQFDIQKNIRDILILADTGPAEYLILERYMESITKDAIMPRIKLRRTKDLLVSIDSFYKKYGPASEDVHSAYKKAWLREPSIQRPTP
ncbi:MAG: hypothetical protein R6W99_10205 [Clostridia bacterium]